MRGLILLSLLAPLCVMAEDANFGRLFTDPAERRQLDNQRQLLRANQMADSQVDKPLEPIEEIAAGSGIVPLEVFDQAPEEIVFSGYLQRSDGETFFWINGMIDQQQNSVVDHIRDGKALIKANQNSVNLKPGQVWNGGERSIKEGYERIDQSPENYLLKNDATQSKAEAGPEE